jgi:hypothetical protein
MRYRPHKTLDEARYARVPLKRGRRKVKAIEEKRKTGMKLVMMAEEHW